MRRLSAFGIAFAAIVISARAMAQEAPAQQPAPEPPAPEQPAPTEQPAPPVPVEVPPPAPQPQAAEERQPPPSIVIDARDDRGQPVRAVTIFVDEKPVAYEADGKPIVLTPGPHTIAVQRNDGTRLRVSAPVNLANGQVAQPVRIALTGHVTEDPERARMLRPDPPVLPRVVAGVGLLAMVTGSILVLARPALPANCNNGCTRETGMTDEQLAHTQSKADTHDTVTHAAIAFVGGGAAVTAAGLLWYFIELPPIRQDARISPWMTAGSGGLSLQGRF